MSDTSPTPRGDREVTVEAFFRLRAEIAEATKDLTEEEYEALIEDLTHKVNEGLRRYVRESRGEDVSR